MLFRPLPLILGLALLIPAGVLLFRGLPSLPEAEAGILAGTAANVREAAESGPGPLLPIPVVLNDAALAERALPQGTPSLLAGITPPTPEGEAAETEPAEQTLTVAPGDTLSGMLTEAGVERADAFAALAVLTEVFPANALRPGQEILLRMEPDGDSRLVGIEVSPAAGHTIVVERRDDGWHAEEDRVPESPHLAQVEAVVNGGVFPALVSAGLPPRLAYAVVRAYSHRVDFQRDLRAGDRVAVAFERMRGPDGTLLRHGRVLYASLTLSGRTQEIWRHDGAEGRAAWYDAAGRPLAGGFLRTPLNGARMSSRFGMRRHPILGYNRMHRGVDFAAPTGTPVYAASDGVVESIRTERGFGKVIRLRHHNNVRTLYAHLSRFAPGLRAGGRVRQGQTIGRVGSTGMSTGPHLHYELHVSGRAVNPATSRLPAPPALAGSALRAFQVARMDLQRQRTRLERGLTEIALVGGPDGSVR
jgi:murein DD-endopeptidase MepM/ murein hydrolase activator NlpD